MFTYWGLGVEITGFTPPDTGKNYTLTPSLAPLAPFKDDCTLMTGLTSFTGGHGSCCCLLTGVNTVRNAKTLTSVDQQLAMHHGSATRFPSLVLGTVRETGFGGPFPMTLSWSKNHTPITPENRPEVLFEKLFGSEDNNTLAAAKQAMAQRASLLDSIKEQAAALQRQVGTADRERLDQYFTSIRDLEERIKVEGEWIDRPKPKVPRPDFGQGSPRDRIAGDGRGYSEYTRLMFDMIALAFQTDSTRAVSHIPRTEGDEAKCYGYLTKSKWDLHTITHNAQEDDKIAHVAATRRAVPGRMGLFPRQAQEREGRQRHVARQHDGRLGHHQRRPQRARFENAPAHPLRRLGAGPQAPGPSRAEGHAGGERLEDGRGSRRHADARELPGRPGERRREGAGMMLQNNRLGHVIARRARGVGDFSRSADSLPPTRRTWTR